MLPEIRGHFGKSEAPHETLSGRRGSAGLTLRNIRADCPPGNRRRSGVGQAAGITAPSGSGEVPAHGFSSEPQRAIPRVPK